MSNSPDHQNGRENGRDNGRDNGREDRNDYNGDGRFRRRRRRGRRRPYDNGDQQQQGTATIQHIKLDVPEDKTIVIGITGEPGAGKSALSQEFAKLGASVIDVDSAGHEVIELPSVKKKLIEAFGEEIISEDGAIVRGAPWLLAPLPAKSMQPNSIKSFPASSADGLKPSSRKAGISWLSTPLDCTNSADWMKAPL